jgi:hypothetical protein
MLLKYIKSITLGSLLYGAIALQAAEPAKPSLSIEQYQAQRALAIYAGFGAELAKRRNEGLNATTLGPLCKLVDDYTASEVDIQKLVLLALDERNAPKPDHFNKLMPLHYYDSHEQSPPAPTERIPKPSALRILGLQPSHNPFFRDQLTIAVQLGPKERRVCLADYCLLTRTFVNFRFVVKEEHPALETPKSQVNFLLSCGRPVSANVVGECPTAFDCLPPRSVPAEGSRSAPASPTSPAPAPGAAALARSSTVP